MKNSLSILTCLLSATLILFQTQPALSQPRSLPQKTHQEERKWLDDLLWSIAFYGEWAEDSVSQSTFSDFKNREGITFILKNGNIVLMDGEYIYKRHYIQILGNAYEIVNQTLDKGIATVKNYRLQYKTGDDIVNSDKVTPTECLAEELTLKVMNAYTGKTFDMTRDNTGDAIIQVKLLGGECPFSFGTTFMIFRTFDPNRLLSPYFALLANNPYYGQWSTDSDTVNDESLISKFENAKGLASNYLFYALPHIAIVDGQDPNKKFIDILINVLGETESEKGVIRKENTGILYRTENSSFRECTAKELTITILNIKTGEIFDIERDIEKDAVVTVKIVGGECPFSFETSHMTSYERRMFIQERVYMLLGFVWWYLNMKTWLKRIRRPKRGDKALGFQYFLVTLVNLYLWEHMMLFSIKDCGVLATLLFSFANIPLLCIQILAIVLTFSPPPPRESRIRTLASIASAASAAAQVPAVNQGIFTGAIFGMVVLRLITHLGFDNNPVLFSGQLIIVVLIDMVRQLQQKMKPKYNFSLYFGNLLPTLAIAVYTNLYYKAFLGSLPQEGFVWLSVIFVLLAYVALPFQLKNKEQKYFTGQYTTLNNETECPICMQPFAPNTPNNAGQELSDIEAGQASDNINEQPSLPVESYVPYLTPEQAKIVKTDCDHAFHKKCLDDWLNMKAECPICRQPIDEID